MKTFQEKVIDIVKKIPKGRVFTYSEVAKSAGNAKASRAVGAIMAKNKDRSVPCHRVIKSDGSVGMYNGLQGKSKVVILKEEGIIFNSRNGVIIR